MDKIIGKELNELLTIFYKENTKVVVYGFLTSLFPHIVSTILFPKLVGNMFSSNDISKLKNNIIKLIILWILRQISNSLSDYYEFLIDTELNRFLTIRLIKSIYIKYESTSKEIDNGLIFSKINQIRLNMRHLYRRIIIRIIPTLVTLIMVSGNFFLINLKLGVYISIGILSSVFCIFNNYKQCLNKSYEQTQMSDVFIKEVGDKFDNVHITSSVKDGLEKEVENSKNIINSLITKNTEQNSCTFAKQNVCYMINTISVSIILFICYRMFVKNELNISKITTVLLSLESLFDILYDLAYYVPEAVEYFGTLESNKTFLSELFSHKEIQGKDFDLSNGNIRFENVSFKYENKNILSNVSVDIKYGDIVTLIGPSGSGKSTFVKLLMRRINPTFGNIFIDNHNINDISPNSIKKYISYMSQNTSTLFNNTIGYNLMYGYDTNIQEKIKSVIEKYNLYKIFENIQLEYNSEYKYKFFDYNVGKRGELLSGGQRQIIHLIRAITGSEYSILIMDEPTVALDSTIRKNVLEMIKNECVNKTVLIITHDPETKEIGDQDITFVINSSENNNISSTTMQPKLK